MYLSKINIKNIIDIIKRVIRRLIIILWFIIEVTAIYIAIYVMMNFYVIEWKTFYNDLELSEDGNYLVVSSTGHTPMPGLLQKKYFYDLNKREICEIGFKHRIIGFVDKTTFVLGKNYVGESSVYNAWDLDKIELYFTYLDNKKIVHYIDIKNSLLLEGRIYYVRYASFRNLLFIGNDSLIYLIDTDTRETILEIIPPENIADFNISGDNWESLNLTFSTVSKNTEDDDCVKIIVFNAAKAEIIRTYDAKVLRGWRGRRIIGNKYNYIYPQDRKYNDLIRKYNLYALYATESDEYTNKKYGYRPIDKYHIESFEETSDGFFEKKDYYVTPLKNRAINSFSYCPAKKILAVGYEFSKGKGFVEGFLNRGWRIRDDGVIVIYDVVSNEIVHKIYSRATIFETWYSSCNRSNEIVHKIYNRDINLVSFTIEKNPDPIVIDDNTRGIKAVDLRKPIE